MKRKVPSIHDRGYRKLVTLLADFRKKAGISQSGLAAQTGLLQPDISKIENFERRIDILEYLTILAALGQGDPGRTSDLWQKVWDCYQASQK